MLVAVPMGPGARNSRQAWLVATAVIFAIVFGAAAAATIRGYVNPSGTVQPPGTAPLSEQLDTENVAWLFGAPLAAFAAAAISAVGLRRNRALPYALLGTAVGIGVFSLVGADAVSIGDWWLNSVPWDTNRAAALFTLLLVPWGTIALLLATVGAWEVRTSPGSARFVHFLTSGVLLGLVLGVLVGVEASAITSVLHCLPVYQSCFTVSSVISGGTLVGGLEGAALGSLCGFVVWIARVREPHPPTADPTTEGS